MSLTVLAGDDSAGFATDFATSPARRNPVGSVHHVKRRDWPAETLEFEVAEVFEWRHRPDRGANSARDEDLSVLGLCVQSGGEVAHRTDCGIAGAVGKPDLAERRVTPRDPDTEPELAAT